MVVKGDMATDDDDDDSECLLQYHKSSLGPS